MNRKWSAKERIAAASQLLMTIQSDMSSGRYSIPGRPNMTTVMHVLHSEPELLNGPAGSDLRDFLQIANDGLFIVIEGGDLSGKTTQADRLCRRIAMVDSRKLVCSFSFPAYHTPTGAFILDWLRGELSLQDMFSSESSVQSAGEMQPLIDAFIDDEQERRELGRSRKARRCVYDNLMFQCVQTVDKYAFAGRIKEELEKGNSVVSSRWWPSSYVYGQDDGLDPKWLLAISESLPEPDVMILLDVDPEVAAARGVGRASKRDRYDRDLAKQSRITRSYRELWEDRARHGLATWRVVDANRPVDQVAESIWSIVAKGSEK